MPIVWSLDITKNEVNAIQNSYASADLDAPLTYMILFCASENLIPIYVSDLCLASLQGKSIHHWTHSYLESCRTV